MLVRAFVSKVGGCGCNPRFSGIAEMSGEASVGMPLSRRGLVSVCRPRFLRGESLSSAAGRQPFSTGPVVSGFTLSRSRGVSRRRPAFRAGARRRAEGAAVSAEAPRTDRSW